MIKSKSIKTTGLGIGTLLLALGSIITALLDTDAATTITPESIAMITAALGLLFARDDSVTSREAGAE